MKLLIVKIGGNIIDDSAQLTNFLKKFAAQKSNRILVHGGGKIATEFSKQMGIESKMVEGRRVTDADALKVVQMVYGGLINKNIVAELQSFNCNAIGLTGADGGIIRARKREVKGIDYGFVGDVEQVNAERIAALLNAGFCPVIAPLTHDGHGQILNTNADTMASVVALAMGAKMETHLIYCFEKSGVLKDVNDNSSVIQEINKMEYEKYKADGLIAQGMIPKLDNAFYAIQKGVKSVTICHAKDLENVVEQKKGGTRLL